VELNLSDDKRTTTHKINNNNTSNYNTVKIKVKVNQSRYRTGVAQRVPGGLRLSDFMTSAQDGGRLSALRTGRLYPNKCSWYSFLLEAEPTPGPYCDRKDFMSAKNPLTPDGIESATFRFVVQHLNHCATAVPNYNTVCFF